MKKTAIFKKYLNIAVFYVFFKYISSFILYIQSIEINTFKTIIYY